LNYKDKTKSKSESKTHVIHKNEMLKLSNKINSLQTKFEDTILKRSEVKLLNNEKSKSCGSGSDLNINQTINSKSKSQVKTSAKTNELNLDNVKRDLKS